MTTGEKPPNPGRHSAVLRERATVPREVREALKKSLFSIRKKKEPIHAGREKGAADETSGKTVPDRSKK